MKIKSSIKKRHKRYAEDIIKFMYNIETKQDANMSLELVSQELSIKPARVKKVISQLMVSNWIKENKDKTFVLTNIGRHNAINIIRKHRTYERYLAEHTGFSPIEWHKRAELMEHKLSNEELEEMNRLLGEPLIDPHGAPIPTETGFIVEKQGVCLNQFPINEIGIVISIEDEPEDMFKIINEHNIHIRTVLKVLKHTNDTLSIQCHNENFNISKKIAENIYVAEIVENTVGKEEIDNVYRLSSLKETEKALILGIADACRGEGRRRLLDLGFVKGSIVTIDLISPMKNPVAYMIRGTSIALREEQAKFILIKKIDVNNEEYAKSKM